MNPATETSRCVEVEMVFVSQKVGECSCGKPCNIIINLCEDCLHTLAENIKTSNTDEAENLLHR